MHFVQIAHKIARGHRTIEYMSCLYCLVSKCADYFGIGVFVA
jgi:hypothetical protein